jgi:polyisoprenoid-binding protein YceI
MMKNVFLALLLSIPLFATDLVIKDGYIAAHTEMLLDNRIDPINNYLYAEINIQDNDITTMRGKFWVEMKYFTSENSNRDESMYEELEIDKYKMAIFTISKVTKTEFKDGYIIDGILNFHGQEKSLGGEAEIKFEDGHMTINATSTMLVSNFGIEMPCIFFMCVRDEVELLIKASF